MTQGTLAQTAPIGGHGFAESSIHRIRLGLRRYRRYRSTLHELAKLSDRELADISIPRSKIDEVARQSAARDIG